MKTYKINYLFTVLIILATTAFLSNQALANIPSNVTPQQLEQFKRLPPAQQKALAQSMGIDIRSIQAQLKQSKNKQGTEQEEILPQHFPRGTQYDEFGNPIFSEQKVEEEEDDGKPKPFGYEVFANEPNTFAPSMDIAVPESYIVGPGDTLTIQIYGKENENYEFPVSREGTITLPQLGPFTVSGMTFSEVKKFLAAEIKNKVLGIDVVITLTELRSIRVFVLGDAYKPGQYVLNSLSSITHAILAAGGINDIGSLRDIQLKRSGELITTLDLYDLLIHGNSSNDVMLKSNDVVFISSVGDQVTIEGEVKRPAIYELKNGETFSSVIAMAGGMLPSAYPSSAVVERFNERNLRTVRSVDFNNETALAMKSKAGDYIRIMKTSEQFEDSVTVIGAVNRPGKYQWHEGQRISDLIPQVHSHLLNDADLAYSLIIREKDIGRNIEVLQFSLFNALSDLKSQDNLTLRAKDKVLVFSNIESNSDNIESLDSFALTKEELLEAEKDAAELKYENKKFWEFYTGENNESSLYQVEEVDQAEETLKQTYKSIEELTGTVSEELEPRELGFFSRKRLLAPVIEKLKRQAASGEPIELIEVDGAVKFPGLYPLAKNAKIQQAVFAAGGLLESAYLNKAEVTRNEIVNEQANKLAIEVQLGLAMKNNVDNNITLQSKDRVNIHHIPAWQENHIVELKGEFKFPGKYTIRRGETLGKLIERAGGFTKFANAKASLFTREKLKQMELENLIKVSESLRMEIASKSLASRDGSQGIDYEQARMLLADLTRVEPVGRLVVDIPRIVKDDDFDVLLENGDALFVPTMQNSINVIGQVQVATSHIYQGELTAFDYVELSGGVKKQADDERIYVIKANGRVEIPSNGSWFASNDNTLEPGDTVVVPLDSAYMDSLSMWQVATQILYQVAVAVAAVGSL